MNDPLKTVETDAAKVKADAIAADSKAVAFVKANAGKIVIALAVIAAVVVWHLL